MVAVLRMEDAFVVFVIGEFQDTGTASARHSGTVQYLYLLNATMTLRPLSSHRASRITGLSPDQRGGQVKGCHEVRE